ncbi:aldo/keto reductase [Rhodococcus sp. P1Y]|uniref:aldo/keto reductase n=1 Tax=Rhodococcus sp. P1Y TaxID=1302308 RepID=UPI000EAE0D65|nr:aldo/keto reductase [Rhodococcus sp. P1Y]AYJ51631.1 aldo/keto reductase [Rhodococcus sp. P1Y]
MPARSLGDLTVSAIGLGSMTITQVAGYDVERGRRTVHAALDAGVTLFDTADSYGPTDEYGVNERALSDALRSWPGPTDDVVVITKGGHTRHGDNWWIDGSAEHLRRACQDSIVRLGLDPLPLYQHHRPDPFRPYEESMVALRALVDDGLARRVGISNANPDQIRVARSIIGDALVSVQNQYSPGFRSSEPEVVLCGEIGLAFLSWSPLGGMRAAKDLGSQFAAFTEVALAHAVSVQQVAIAWQLQRWPHVIPIPGASRPESVRDSIRAVDLVLDHRELALLDAPIVGVD